MRSASELMLAAAELVPDLARPLAQAGESGGEPSPKVE